MSAGAITAEIRHLTINNTGGNDYSVGLYTSGVTNGSFSMNSVTATGGTNSYGVYNYDSSASIRNSAITGTTNSIVTDDSSAKVADTVLGGGVSGGGFPCVGVCDTAFVALNANCGPTP